MRDRGNAGIRFLMALAVITIALLVEYAISDGGVLRWLVGAASAPRAAPEERQQAAEAARQRAKAEDGERRAPAPPPAAAARPTAPPAPRPGVLPLSSSFEDDEAGWAYDARGGDGIGARSMDTAYNGHFSLYSQASDGANRGWPGWVGPRYRLAPGRSYVLRAWAISPDGGNGWLDLALYDASGAWLGGRSTGCSRERPGRQWQPLELRYSADDPRVATVGVALLHCLNHTRGRATSIYFDDVRFEAAD